MWYEKKRSILGMPEYSLKCYCCSLTGISDAEIQRRDQAIYNEMQEMFKEKGVIYQNLILQFYRRLAKRIRTLDLTLLLSVLLNVSRLGN